MQREILHLRLPSFPLQVICGDKRKFLDWPMVLCGGDFPSARVLVVNPKARLEGIRRGMLLAQAKRLRR
ncbi:MAG: Y-family DNA polymerase [Candidatus Helarchaeota archaeon]